MTKAIFDECDKAGNDILTGRMWWSCMGALRRDVYQTTMKNMRWNMSHSHETSNMIFRGAMRHGRTSCWRGIKKEHFQGYLEKNWDEVQAKINEENPNPAKITVQDPIAGYNE
jgi:hypothetical protein